MLAADRFRGSVDGPLSELTNQASKNQSQFEAIAESKYSPPLNDLNGLRDSRNFFDGRHPNRLSTASFSTAAANTTIARNQASEGGLLGCVRPKPHKIWRKKYIKLLVVGDSGLGKTTLIRSLISTPGERIQVHDGSFTPTDQFLKDPESLCSTISWRDEEDRVVWVYKIQDTPGYGDTLDLNACIRTTIEFVELQNQKWLKMEQSRDRKEDLSEIEDPRIDLCLFCIGPHRLRASDLKFMYEIGRCVPIVPVVTKADTMTIREAGMYRAEVASKISNPMLPGIKDKINVFNFERDTLTRAGVEEGASAPPFLVVASNDINEELNNSSAPMFWPERRYSWGVAEAFNKDHSDLLLLRALLLKEALEEVNKTKRQRYETWRRTQLRAFKLGCKARKALLFTIVPALVCLQIGRLGLKYEDVKNLAVNGRDKVKAVVKRLEKPLGKMGRWIAGLFQKKERKQEVVYKEVMYQEPLAPVFEKRWGGLF